MTIPPPRPPAILDTNVASFLAGERPQAELYRDDCKDRVLTLSFQTVAEMLAGAEIRRWGAKRRAQLATFLARYETIHPDDENGMVTAWATVRAAQRAKGKTLSVQDAWVAATALASGLVLIAHDRGFRHVPGLDLICHAPEGEAAE